MKFPVGIQLWSVRDNCANDLPGTLKAIKEMGYDGVEPYTLYNYSPEEFKKILDDNGLRAFSSHVSIYEYEDENGGGYDAVAEKYAKIGVDYTAFPYIGGPCHPGDEKFYQTLISMEKIIEAAKKAGLDGVAYHNHENELDKLSNGVVKLDALLGVVPELQGEFDLGWLTKAGADPIEYIERYAGRLPLVHMKELAWTGTVPQKVRKAIGIECGCPDDPESAFIFKPIGTGIMPFDKILKALEKAGTRYLIIEQDEATAGRDIMDCVAEAVKNLKAMMD